MNLANQGDLASYDQRRSGATKSDNGVVDNDVIRNRRETVDGRQGRTTQDSAVQKQRRVAKRADGSHVQIAKGRTGGDIEIAGAGAIVSGVARPGVIAIETNHTHAGKSNAITSCDHSRCDLGAEAHIVVTLDDPFRSAKINGAASEGTCISTCCHQGAAGQSERVLDASGTELIRKVAGH